MFKTYAHAKNAGRRAGKSLPQFIVNPDGTKYLDTPQCVLRGLVARLGWRNGWQESMIEKLKG